MALTDAKVTWIGAAVALALGVAVGALGMKSCTPEPETGTVVETRTDTIPGPADTVFVTVRVPVRAPYALPVYDSTDVHVLQAMIESILTDYDQLQLAFDSLSCIVATSTTTTPGAVLTAHLDMDEFRRDPRRGLYATAVITSRDTTRTTLVTEPGSILDYIGLGLHAGAGYNVITRTVDLQVGAGLQVKLDKLFF
jgi:hypothetical protein